MAVTRVQANAGQATGVAAVTLTLASAPTPGNLLVFVTYNSQTAQQSGVTCTGFTQDVITDTTLNFAAAVLSRIADGTEGTSFTATWAATNTGTVTGEVMELNAGAGKQWSSSSKVAATGHTEGTGTSIALTASAATAGPSYAVAVLGIGGTSTFNNTWTNGFASDGSTVASGRQEVAVKESTVAETLSTTETMTVSRLYRLALASYTLATTSVTDTGTLTAAGTGSATLAGSASHTSDVTAVASAGSTLGGTRTTTATLAGSATAAATVTGSGVISGRLTGTATASSTLTSTGTATGTLTASGTGAATVAGARTTSGTVTASGSASATVGGTQTAIGALTATGVGAASLAGTTTSPVPWVGSTAWNPTDLWPGPDTAGTDTGTLAAAGSASSTLAGARTTSATLTATAGATATLAGGHTVAVTLAAAAVATAQVAGLKQITALATAQAIATMTLSGSSSPVSTYNPHVYVYAPLASSGISTAPLLNNGASTAPLASNGASTAPVSTTT